MTIRTIVFSIAFLVPLAASAQAPKSVEVINDPLAVEVTNLPAVQDVNVLSSATGGCEVKTFQLVGFTSTLYTGNLGGVLGSTEKCQREFSGSRMCTSEEVQATTNLPSHIPDFSWVDPFEGILGRGSCAGDLIIDEVEIVTRQWTCDLLGAPCRFDPSSGATLESTGARFPTLCSEEKPIACCALMP